MEFVDNSLMHVGVGHLDNGHSGRYPWGSGEDSNQRFSSFSERVKSLKKEGLSETEIAKSMGLKSSTELRVLYSEDMHRQKMELASRVKALSKKGWSPTAIGKELGKNESSIRDILNENYEAKLSKSQVLANLLKKEVDAKGMIDVGTGVEKELGADVSAEKLNAALYILKNEGYNVFGGRMPQITNPSQMTTLKVLTTPDHEHKDIFDYDKVKSVTDYEIHDVDGIDEIHKKFVYPESLDSKRLMIRYAEDGGTDRDGIIELRRGVDDLSLGGSAYSQVRILVDGTHYLKGVAVYADDLPKGIDVRFNTNKSNSKSKMEVLKEINDDPDNPFGANIKEGGQSYYLDKDGKKKLSLINKARDEGDWEEWANKIPSQFLAKQDQTLIKKQLKLSIDNTKSDLDDILNLTNPTIKRNLLNDFASECDSKAEHLYAAALPRQKYQVILPVPSMKDNEVYAPNYNNGEKVALIRYPHAGTFEIPILTVNNKQKDAIKLIGKNASDAVCINPKVARRLSGADFDGDTVMVIPTHDSGGKIKIKSTNPIKDLEGFDPKLEYSTEGKTGVKLMAKGNVGNEMGKISNLITDMTILGASEAELTKAVRHSMVVIDAYKHKLDYKQSEIDNDIKTLKNKYQGRIDEETGNFKSGAATIISRAKSQVSVPERKGSPQIDPNTGEISYKLSGRTINETERSLRETIKEINKLKDSGDTSSKDYAKLVAKQNKLQKQIDAGESKITTKMVKSTQMAETKDARTLVSDAKHLVEMMYADYANSLKSLANTARKEMLATGRLKYNPEAAKEYASEVDHLKSQLFISEKNPPRERAAQRIASGVVKAKQKDNPDMTKKEIKKISQQALTNARAIVGAKRKRIDISEKEWEAIQAGAISDSVLNRILKYADSDTVRKYATPKGRNDRLSGAQLNLVKSMLNSNYSNEEIAKRLGVSVSTILQYK